MFTSDGAIGVMDSGVGGVSVLNALRILLPYENVVYLSDSMHAPYGKRDDADIRDSVTENAKRLIFMGCKALVIACNTATAVAVAALRERFSEIPVVGLEPAVRPAVMYAKENGEDVLVLATDLTVRTPRFLALCERNCDEFGIAFNDKNSETSKSRLCVLAIQNTVDFVERGQCASPAHIEYLKEKFLPYRDHKFGAVVVGCTHFPFAENSISEALGYRPRFFDGAHGAARRLVYLLKEKKMERSFYNGEKGWVEWLDTSAEVGFSQKLRGFRYGGH